MPSICDKSKTLTQSLAAVSLAIVGRANEDEALIKRSFEVYGYALREHGEPQAFEAAQKYAPNVPLGIARFENDNILLPKLWNKTMGPLVLESLYEKGGHFAAYERPDAIIGDLREMFAEVEVHTDVLREDVGISERAIAGLA